MNVPGHEVWLIAKLLSDPEGMAEVADLVQSDHFQNRELGEVYKGLLHFDKRSERADNFSMVQWLESRTNIGGDWLKFIQSVTSQRVATPLVELAELVFNQWRVRKLIKYGDEVIARAKSMVVGDAPALHDWAMGQLALMERPADTNLSTVTASEGVDLVIDDLRRRVQNKEMPGADTGWGKLNWLIGGWEPCGFTVLQAATGDGKSALALNLAINAVKKNENFRAAFYGMEMPNIQTAGRLLANSSSVNGMKIRMATLSEGEIDKVLQGQKGTKVWGDRLSLIYCSQLSIGGLQRNLHRTLMTEGSVPGLVVVDYLQIMSAESARNREQEVAKIADGLLAIAHMFKIHILVLSQENEDGRMRESKRAEMHAWNILKLRPREEDFDNPDHVKLRMPYNLVLSKTRLGPRGKVPLIFMREYQRFVLAGREDGQ